MSDAGVRESERAIKNGALITHPLDEHILPGVVRDRVIEAARYIPLDQLGTTDDCGFAPFADDLSTSRDVAFRKISARVQGTLKAAEALARA